MCASPGAAGPSPYKSPENSRRTSRMWGPTSCQAVRCVQVLGPPAPVHTNHLKTPEELQEGRNFKGASVRLQSLTEQLHVKIRVKIPASLSATSEHQQRAVSLVKQLGSQGLEARIIVKYYFRVSGVCASPGAAGPSPQIT